MVRKPDGRELLSARKPDGRELLEVRDGEGRIAWEAIPDDDPIGSPSAFWAFDEGSGSTLADHEGSRDGTIFGAAWIHGGSSHQFSGDGYGGAFLTFDGTDDYVDLGSFEFPNTNQNFTFVTWLYFGDAGGGSQSALGSDNSAWLHHSGSENRLYCRSTREVSPRPTVIPEADLQGDTWYMAWMRRDGDILSGGYNDVGEVGSGDVSGSTQADEAYTFGARPDPEPPDLTQAFEGGIDYAVAYDYVLSDSDLATLYSNTRDNYTE